MQGNISGVLEFLQNQYNCGADPIVILQDLLELSHWLTKVKILPEAANDVSLPEAERTKGKELAEKLSMAVLTRTWQMLLKGINEAKSSSASLAAVEMVLIRLAYASSLPVITSYSIHYTKLYDSLIWKIRSTKPEIQNTKFKTG